MIDRFEIPFCRLKTCLTDSSVCGMYATNDCPVIRLLIEKNGGPTSA